MIVREVNFLKLRDYVDAAWKDDDELIKFYDLSLKQRTHERMVSDTLRKIYDLYERDTTCKFWGVDIEREMVGFIVLNEKMKFLYSFGINKRYRNQQVLEPFFKYISQKLKNDFFTLMNMENVRAIDWLKRCGMVEVKNLGIDYDVLYLKYELCP